LAVHQNLRAIDFARLVRLTARMLTTAGNLLFRYRNALFPFACVLLFLPDPDPDPFPDLWIAVGVGAVIAFLGQLIRIATIGLRYVVRGGRGRRVYADDLVTTGIYAHTRNPMYVGNLLIAIGLAVASNSWITIAIAVPLGLFMYASIIAAEEAYLRGRFGAAFDAYCRDVPRWLPRLAGMGTTLASMQFHWRRVVVKEYGTPFGWISVLVLMTMYNLWDAGVWRQSQHQIRELELVLLGAVLVWFAAWSMKRTRTIVAD
jgi:protein-S-isoprenylcysteine O-methyltransferase Ste14